MYTFVGLVILLLSTSRFSMEIKHSIFISNVFKVNRLWEVAIDFGDGCVQFDSVEIDVRLA